MNVGMLIVCGVADWLVVRWYVRCRMYSSWRRSLWTSVVLCTALNGFIIVNRGYIDVIVVVLFLFASAIGHGVTNEVQALVERTRSRRS